MSAQFDTGSWTCSVSATTYLGRLYLRDTLESQPVHLTILYPPSHAKIRVANDVSGQVVGVSGRPLDVECLAYGGVPSPEIAWHLGGVLQSQEAILVDTFTDMDTGLDVTRSTLRLEVRREDDGKMISCELLHPALGIPLWVKAVLNVGCMYKYLFFRFFPLKMTASQ